uniref:Glucosidase 2 subunit beta n=1 Tax=Panstrongylus lignarius TaxID=156445 RepID=A0A224XAH6_9HEMI
MGVIEVLLFFFTMFIFSRSSEKLLPRGVPVSQQALYDSLQDFTCFDGTLRLPFVFVNDDYCDCQDGSDEPGTSACPNGRFYCQNVGYIPHELPSSRVNDGVCDCCDASDEYVYGNCTNVCSLLGAEAKKAAEKEAEIASQGNELRLQMIAAGKQIKLQKQERLSALEAEKIEAARLKDEASRLKQIAESAEYSALETHRLRKEEQKEAEEKLEKEKLEQEAKEMFGQLDSNEDNILQTDELMKEVFDQNKDGDVSDSELKFLFNTNTDVSWDTFLEAWPQVKPYFLVDKEQNIPLDNKDDQVDEASIIDYSESPTTESPPYFDSDSDQKSDNTREEDWEKDVALKPDEEEEEEEAEPEHEEEDEDDDKRDEELEQNKPEDQYDENTLKIIDEANKARSRLESAERSLQDVERELSRVKDSLEKDYGPEDEFIPLDGQCYTYSDREYTYKLCPFDQVVQMGKSGGSETRLGVWAGWVEDSQYKTMLYDKGQTCWNGPQRSTKVSLNCGLETAVIGASEPNKCEYELILKTPAACKFPSQTQPVDTHDEF